MVVTLLNPALVGVKLEYPLFVGVKLLTLSPVGVEYPVVGVDLPLWMGV